jgi:hypothetical protein
VRGGAAPDDAHARAQRHNRGGSLHGFGLLVLVLAWLGLAAICLSSARTRLSLV